MFVDVPLGGTWTDPTAKPPGLVLRTEQELGFTCFVLATVTSLLLGHYVLFQHMADPEVKAAHHVELGPDSGPRLRYLLKQPACTLKQIEGALTGKSRWYVAPALLFTSAFVVAGCMLPAFTLELYAPTPELPHKSVTYSFIDFARALPDFSEKRNSFPTRFCQFTFWFFAIIAIHVHLAILLVLWFVKIKPKHFRFLNTLAHSLFAWSALDVAALSLVITVLEMAAANFVGIGDSERSFLSQFTLRPVTTGKGIEVNTEIHEGTWLTLLGCALHYWIGRVVMQLLEHGVLAQTELEEHPSLFKLPSLASMPAVSEVEEPAPGGALSLDDFEWAGVA